MSSQEIPSGEYSLAKLLDAQKLLEEHHENVRTVDRAALLLGDFRRLENRIPIKTRYMQGANPLQNPRIEYLGMPVIDISFHPIFADDPPPRKSMKAARKPIRAKKVALKRQKWRASTPNKLKVVRKPRRIRNVRGLSRSTFYIMTRDFMKALMFNDLYGCSGKLGDQKCLSIRT